jgi:hypothetical protein
MPLYATPYYNVFCRIYFAENVADPEFRLYIKFQL